MVRTDRHSKPDTSLQNPSTLSHNTPTYGLTPYLDKHIKWGFIPYNNIVANRVYDYPPVGKGSLLRGNGRQMGFLKVVLPSLCRLSQLDAALCTPKTQT